MRFFQVHFFYEQYLTEFYRNQPALALKPYDEQLTTVLQDGFSASHLFIRSLQEVGYATGLSICNNRPAQARWVQENLPGLAKLADMPFETVLCQITDFAPDILYLPALKIFDSAFVRKLPVRPKLVVGWYGVEVDPAADLSDFDLVLSNSTNILHQAKLAGARTTAWFFPGMPDWLASATDRVPKRYDLSFCGSWSSQHSNRNALLEHMAKAAPQLGNPSIAYFLLATQPLSAAVQPFSFGPLWGMSMYRALKGSRIVFNADVDGACGEAGNMRLFEATALGSFVLAEHQNNIGDYFVPGKEVETFANTTELLDKLRYYLAHPTEREEIALSGKQRCMRDYSLTQRARELDGLFRQLLHQPAASSAERFQNILACKQPMALASEKKDEAADSVRRLRDGAESLVLDGHFREATQLLNKAKALRKPLQGVDYLRALCFLSGAQDVLVCEALREELRYFPDNQQAEELLGRIESRALGQAGCYGEYAEFSELLSSIRPYTMLSEERLFSLYSHARKVCEQNIPGHFVECGVAAGGASALLAVVIKRYSKIPRLLYSCDTFTGMPDPTGRDTARGMEANATGWGAGTCAAPESSVRLLCEQLGVGELLITVKGLFQETLPILRETVGKIALLHLDGDWYESTRTILNSLYDVVIDGGMLQADDYGLWEGCRQAIDEFQAERGIHFELHDIDGTGVWFTKYSALSITLEQEVLPENADILNRSGALERMRGTDGRLRPLALFCETVNICNSACLFCPYSKQTRSKGCMSDTLFQTVLQQYAAIGGGYLSLTPMVGDFLLDRHLLQRLTALREVADSIIPSVTTNLCSLGNWDDAVVQQLLQTFSLLHVSCYGMSREEHHQITRHDHFDQFLFQMRRLLRIRRELGAPTQLTIGFRNLYHYDAKQIEAFQVTAFGEQLPVSGAGSSYCNWGNSMGGALPGNAYFLPTPTNQVPCLFLAMALMVFHDGSVSACACCDYDGQPALHLGRVSNAVTLADMFNSPANGMLWRCHQEQQLPGYCKHCSFHLPLSALHAGHPLLTNLQAFIGG